MWKTQLYVQKTKNAESFGAERIFCKHENMLQNLINEMSGTIFVGWRNSHLFFYSIRCFLLVIQIYITELKERRTWCRVHSEQATKHN